MARLTQKQENFCLAYIETGNAAEAYRRAYNTSQMKPESVHRLAKQLMDNVKIASRIEELRKPAREKAGITLENHLATLERLRRLAEEKERYSAAIAAEVARGKASGLYVEKVEHSGNVGISVTFNANIERRPGKSVEASSKVEDE